MAELETLVDRLSRDRRTERAKGAAVHLDVALTDDQWRLPETAFQAMARGFRGRCPRCDQSRLFPKFLKPIEHCPACQQDWTPQQADDFPAYVSIIVTGHIMAPIIIALITYTKLPNWVEMAIIMPLAVLLMILLLQPAKGAIIAFQWWMGMHGFSRPALTNLAQGSEDDR